MNFKSILTVALLIGINGLTENSYAESSVWKISKGDKYFYIGGTMHVLTQQDHPLPPEFFKAYKDSDKLIFETDIAGSKTPETQQKFLTAMMYGSDKRLKNDLTAETYSKLQKFLYSRNVPIENVSTFEPWAVALIIAVAEYQRMGLVQEYGVDEYFTKLAATDKKALGQLETMDEQISFMESMAKIDPNIMIEYTLRDIGELPQMITMMKNIWRSGDIEAFTTNNFMVEMRSQFPEMYDTLIINRNNNWMPDLTNLNNNDTKEFVLVGALHLNGKQGLLNQLQLAGFKVDQLK